MELFLSLSPLLVITTGVIGFKKPAKWVSLFAMIYTMIIAILYFGTEKMEVFKQTKIGIIEGSKMVYMIWAAFLILNMLVHTNAMNKIKESIAELTLDRRKQIIIIAFCFGGFLEGVAGAGTPAAICAPFLMALGLPVLEAVSAALIFNGIAASLGAAGLTTIGGFSPYLSTQTPEIVFEMMNTVPWVSNTPVPTNINVEATIMNISMATSFIHFFGALFCPMIVLFILYRKKAFDKEIIIFSIFTGFVYGMTLILMGTFVGAEFPTICAGIFSLIAAVIYIKLFNKKTVIPPEFSLKLDGNEQKNEMSTLKAVSTYLILMIIFPLVRFFAPLWFIKLGFAVWIGTTIAAVCLIGSIILKTTSSMPKYMKESFISVVGALIAMSALLAVANLMKVTGMLTIIATALANLTGKIYPAFAVIIGSLGSFVAGTTTGSNIMFSALHAKACMILELSIPVIFAAQSTGGALGNMICTNNVVAVCTTVGLKDSEGIVMRKVFEPICILWTLYAILSLVYVYVLFPNLPMVLK
ncbi:MAG: L-lactate permease [Fusobacterium sp.]|uniref:L-lactate permease n=1 Tax=Fusobacterium sp. TaxID=68766 RepID=UPI0026DAC20D|nr:L-lactate permease [Fusobacterium sp.]MDO4690169.1 L-lactate permease [Fusobacterium sp.]